MSILLKYLNKVTEINDVDISTGLTPLLYAINNSRIEIVKFLIENGADIEAEDTEGKTSLILSVENDDIEKVKYLVENGADLEADDGYETASQIAVINKNLEIATYLVEKGASLYLSDEVINGDLELVKYLVEDCDRNNLEIENKVLYQLIDYEMELFEYFVEKGADLDAVDDEGKTLLTHAVIHSEIKTIKYLVEKGANLNTIDDECYTPLFRIIEDLDYTFDNDALKIVKLLVENGADLEAKDKEGNTILLYLIQYMCDADYENYDILEYLFTKKPNIKAVNNDGDTILSIASIHKNLKLFNYLLEKIKNY